MPKQLPLLSGGEQKQQAFTPLKYKKTFRIAVSGDVRVTETELKIIDTPEFQRLKRIRQLGPSIQVYATAVHTRFDHSLGVLHMAEHMVRAIHEARFQGGHIGLDNVTPIEISHEQHKLTRLYALLHDITHVPFGHTLEDELKIFSAHDNADSRARFLHFLGDKSSIGKVICEREGREFYDRLIAIFLEGKNGRLKHQDEFIHHLVSDTICADLLDYAKRDTYFCNLEIGLPYRFLDHLVLHDVPISKEHGGPVSSDERQSELRARVVVRLWKQSSGVPRRDLLTDMAGLLEARYMIAERVYFHHGKIIAGTMLGRSVFEAVRAGIISECELWELSDDALLYKLASSDSRKQALDKKESAEISRNLAKAYEDRELYAIIKKYGDDAFADAQHTTGFQSLKDEALLRLRDPESRTSVENDIAALIGAPPGHILIYPADPPMNGKVARAIVVWNGRYRLLEEVEDRVLNARLKATREAHKMLWGLVLMGHRSLTYSQRRNADHVFSAQFIHGRSPGGKERAAERISHVVRDKGLADPRLAKLSSSNFEECVRIVSTQLVDETVLHKRTHSSDIVLDLLLSQAKEIQSREV